MTRVDSAKAASLGVLTGWRRVSVFKILGAPAEIKHAAISSAISVRYSISAIWIEPIFKCSKNWSLKPVPWVKNETASKALVMNISAEANVKRDKLFHVGVDCAQR